MVNQLHKSFSLFRKSNLLPPLVVDLTKNYHFRQKDGILCSWRVVLVVLLSKTIRVEYYYPDQDKSIYPVSVFQ